MKINTRHPMYRLTSTSLYLDYPLLGFVVLLIAVGLVILYSASGQNLDMVLRQGTRLFLALGVMVMLSFIPPHKYKRFAPWMYAFGFLLLIGVVIMGKMGKGAQRWLDLHFFRFQPSEIMKLAVPLMLAWYIDDKPLQKNYKTLAIASLLIFFPAILIAKQPDLGTAIMVVVSGLTVIFLAGISFRLILFVFSSIICLMPILWHVMHDYQKERILTLINPQHDPLGSGYHIIQSKIAIGSGGALGKGWLEGSQAHLSFLPEHATDFIFAVCGEEFGFFGSLLLIVLVALIALQSLYIAKNAQTDFTRLTAASLAMMFFLSAFVNMGMVMGILPVVGIPLPLVSYGGTAMVTFLAGFGILMSISSHRILFNKIEA